jgi:proteasome lid subunit RPN8/RPN11
MNGGTDARDGLAPLRVAAGRLDDLRRHAVEAYPHECCGALIGSDGAVRAIHPLPNATDEGPRRRFLIRPGDYRGAERAAREAGLELLGFYHSHPDHPAVPSAYDLEHAWPTFAYVIVSVRQASPGAVRCWRLREDRTGFDEQEIHEEED